MFENSPEFLKPRLRLFLSADIVGSTALKQSPLGQQKRHEQRTKWFTKIQGFYFEAQTAFATEFEEQRDKCNDDARFGEAPKLWKTVGDEVLFTKVVSDHRQVAQTLHCWMAAVERMRRFIKKDDTRLDVKSSAWLAGFPFRNSEVAVPDGDAAKNDYNGDWILASGKYLEDYYADPSTNKVSLDFIGPNIDIGFRLSSYCSSRKLTVSVEIAYILSTTNPKEEIDDRVFSIFFDGSLPLKGVLGGLNYPIFWLDISPDKSLARFEDKLAGIEKLDRDDLRKYCIEFFTEYSVYTFPPFIVSDQEPEFNIRPDWYDEEHANLVKAYDSAKEQNELISESLGKDDAPSNTDDPDAENQRQELEAWVDNALRKKGEDEA
jgi:hypothetical protein